MTVLSDMIAKTQYESNDGVRIQGHIARALWNIMIVFIIYSRFWHLYCMINGKVYTILHHEILIVFYKKFKNYI